MHFGIDNMSVVDSDYSGSADTAYRRDISIKQWINETEIVVEEKEEEDPKFDESGEEREASYRQDQRPARAIMDRPFIAPNRTFEDPPHIVRKGITEYPKADQDESPPVISKLQKPSPIDTAPNGTLEDPPHIDRKVLPGIKVLQLLIRWLPRNRLPAEKLRTSR